MKQNMGINMLKPMGMDTYGYRCYEILTSPSMVNLYYTFAFMGLCSVLSMIMRADTASAYDVFGVNTDTGQIDSSNQITGDTKELMTASNKFVKFVRWGAIILTAAGICVAAVKYQNNDRHEEAWKGLSKAVVAFIVIAISLAMTNYIIGAFTK